MERTYDEKIHERVNHLPRRRTCMQIECSEDAFTIEWKKRFSSQTVGESKMALESSFEEHVQDVWERTG